MKEEKTGRLKLMMMEDGGRREKDRGCLYRNSCVPFSYEKNSPAACTAHGNSSITVHLPPIFLPVRSDREKGAKVGSQSGTPQRLEEPPNCLGIIWSPFRHLTRPHECHLHHTTTTARARCHGKMSPSRIGAVFRNTRRLSIQCHARGPLEPFGHRRIGPLASHLLGMARLGTHGTNIPGLRYASLFLAVSSSRSDVTLEFVGP